MEAALEGDGAAAAGVGAGYLDGVLHRLGAGGEEEGTLGGRARHQGVELLGKLDIARVGGDLEAGVAELLELLAHGGDHLGVVVAGVEHGDAGGKVDVAVALHVPQLGVLGPVDEDRQQGADALYHGRFTAGLPGLVTHLYSPSGASPSIHCDGPAAWLLTLSLWWCHGMDDARHPSH
ncbi:hypothetical protein D3C85_694810 [compost metagenome]